MLVLSSRWEMAAKSPWFKLFCACGLSDEASNALLSSGIKSVSQQLYYFFSFIFLETINQQYHELCFCQPGLLWMTYLEAFFYSCLRA